jgi:DNA-binding NtrC family response regulator
MAHTILVADDEAVQRDMLAGFLRKRGFEVSTVPSGAEAVAASGQQVFDVAFVDLKMPGMDGIETLRRMREGSPETAVVIMTAYGSVESAVEAMQLGAFHYVTKPINLDEIRLLIERAIEKQMLVAENEYLREQLEERFGFDQIVGESAAMQQVLSTVARVADSNATVLIQGESGTGKELVARALHQLSPRQRARFVAVSCAALPESLLEAELFGHEKGAFTGADRMREGRFEIADGGTLLLDEVGEIPVGMQVKLLRVLQEQEFERVGGRDPIKVDVRVIAATNQSLPEKIKRREFREDLYYRLNVVTLTIPPLRERKEDIMPLVEHFRKKFADESGRSISGMTREARDLLLRYSWPGNAREVANAIERAVVMSRSPVIDVRDLPLHIRGAGEPEEGDELALESVEKRHIERVLGTADWNMNRAADLLGIHRNTLRAKMRRFGLKRSGDALK